MPLFTRPKGATHFEVRCEDRTIGGNYTTVRTIRSWEREEDAEADRDWLRGQAGTPTSHPFYFVVEVEDA